MKLWDRTDLPGLWVNIATAVSAALLLNAIIFIAGWSNGSIDTGRAQHLPPDSVIGAVWTGLFAIMGAARWYVVRSSQGGAASLARAAFAFMGWCLAYPFLTEGLSSRSLGLLANGVTMGLNVALCLVLLPVTKRAALLFALPIAWVAFASFALLGG